MEIEQGKQVRAICIKEYQDEDSLVEFENGEIEEEDIKVYEVGDFDYVIDGLYNNAYWKKI